MRRHRALRHHTCVRVTRSALAAAMLATTVAGCQTTAPFPDITGSIGGPRPGQSAPDTSRTALDSLSERYRDNPRDAEIALRYGQALRANGQRAQAVAVLEGASMANPNNKALLAQYGRALADNGNFKQAFDALSQAHSPSNPDWSILSVQGTTLDQMGRHEDARRYYASALKIRPEEPSVLSNLGLSYMLSKDLPKAEDALRRAHAGNASDARIRQNLALVIGLQGRFAEAETIIKADLPPEEAAANVAYLRQMLSRDGVRQSGRGDEPDLARRS